MKTTIKKIIIHLIFLILGFILACCTMDSITYQSISVSSEIGAKSNAIEFSNTTSEDNFFYDTTLLYYEDTQGQGIHVDQFNTASFIYYGIELPFNPSFTIGATIDTNYTYQLVVWFDSIKKPTLGFSVWLRQEFTLTRVGILQSYNDYYMSTTGFNPTFNYESGYREWKVEPSLATGNLILFTFDTGLTTTSISRPFDNITYSLGGEQLYNAGYNEGYNSGKDIGYNEGYNTGYDKALSEGISNPEHIFYTIWSILTTCGDLLYQFFTIPLFGDVSVGFVLIIIPFTFGFIENVIKVIIKLVTMFLGGN